MGAGMSRATNGRWHAARRGDTERSRPQAFVRSVWPNGNNWWKRCPVRRLIISRPGAGYLTWLFGR